MTRSGGIGLICVAGVAGLLLLLWKARPVAAPALPPAVSVPKLAKWDSVEKRSEAEFRLHQREKQTPNPFCDHTPCQVIHEVLGEYDLPYKGRPTKVVIGASHDKEATCHACAPLLSFFEFEGNEKEWKLVRSQFAITDWGQFGSPYGQGITVDQVGDDLYAMFLAGGSTHQGITESFTQVLLPAKGEWKVVANIQTLEEDSGSLNPGANDWRASISVEGKGPGPWDLVVTSDGVRDQTPLKNKTERYKFMTAEYALAE